MEDAGSDTHESRNLSPISENELSSHLSVASDSDYSVSSRSNLSDVEDTTEISYFKNVAQDLNSSNSPVVSKCEHILIFYSQNVSLKSCSLCTIFSFSFN